MLTLIVVISFQGGGGSFEPLEPLWLRVCSVDQKPKHKKKCYDTYMILVCMNVKSI